MNKITLSVSTPYGEYSVSADYSICTGFPEAEGIPIPVVSNVAIDYDIDDNFDRRKCIFEYINDIIEELVSCGINSTDLSAEYKLNKLI